MSSGSVRMTIGIVSFVVYESGMILITGSSNWPVDCLYAREYLGGTCPII